MMTRHAKVITETFPSVSFMRS